MEKRWLAKIEDGELLKRERVMETMFEEWIVMEHESSISDETRAIMERAGVGGALSSALESSQLAAIGVTSGGFGFDARNSMRLFFVDSKTAKSPVEIFEVLVSQQKKGATKVEPVLKSKAVLSAATWATMAPAVMGDFNEQLKSSKRKVGSWKKKGRTPVDDSFGKELIALAWAVEDIPADRQDLVEKALVGWASLAREERWWLYLKAEGDSPDQAGGWRKALRLALSE